MATRIEGHGGDLIAETLRAHDIDRVFTLSGGHIFPIFDGLHTRGMTIVDTRHEQAAAFAAEAHGKLARVPGVAALTAGPGVTNGMSAITSAHFNGSPMLVLGGRAPELRWGQGSLQEMDHVPLVASVTKMAETVFETAAIADRTAAALHEASRPRRGPTFLDFPMDILFSRAEAEIRGPSPHPWTFTDDGSVGRVLAEAERPVLLIGSDVWAGGAEKAARVFVESQRIPAFMNGMGRGVLPADHDLAFSAARGHAFGRADLVIVVGTALDFRLGFGNFGDAKVVHIMESQVSVARHVELAAGVSGGALAPILEALAGAPTRDREAWIAELRATEASKREGFKSEMATDTTPIHPSRVYGELVPRLARDGIVICDGGDFASYAGKYVEVYESLR